MNNKKEIIQKVYLLEKCVDGSFSNDFSVTVSFEELAK